MTYGLYIGISALPIKTGTRESLRAQVDHLDPADRKQGWTIAPVSEREPWPRHLESASVNPLWVTAGIVLLGFSAFAFLKLLLH